MRLLTLNCHSWQEEQPLEKLNQIVQQILAQDYDVVALQEVSQLMDTPIVYDDVRNDNFAYLIQQALKEQGQTYSLVWDFAHIGYDKYEEGLALLTKHPILKSDSYYVSRSQDTFDWKSRKIVRATIQVDGTPITFNTCHLGWWADEVEPFQEQFNHLMARMDPLEWTFFLGDFNNDALERNTGYDYMMQRGLHDVFLLAKETVGIETINGNIDGWEDNQQGLRIDLVLSNRKIDVERVGVVFDGIHGPVVSDHYGVEVDIQIQKNEH
ncbi:endonuclease [Exiguobacterium sp. Leaf187]|uniref:Endonuclease n=1 Tax=Exiguobacterium indicum TaxID=296995 RepID=A0A0V8GDL3_9BACL|nr:MULTISPECIES: endonuclease/exonuclease/phosphatase family protein [Exiguobacterium]AHA31051.1 endonuclease [Exiguobacterium sp. MH3]KNH37240.1 endonuclease [Exiguobacterium acetylicum]KQS16853.1 endonuclease [Exiguobacterium sp. Leaf187]KSU48392.1 endonuclease [Exiguobacterium enclense]NTY10954.1 endonuclease [Exiguobacterium sp. JMULE1]